MSHTSQATSAFAVVFTVCAETPAYSVSRIRNSCGSKTNVSWKLTNVFGAARNLDALKTRVPLLAKYDHRIPNKISWPLLDRIDIHVEVPAVKCEEMTGEATGETSRISLGASSDQRADRTEGDQTVLRARRVMPAVVGKGDDETEMARKQAE
jgi:hypothetical protein